MRWILLALLAISLGTTEEPPRTGQDYALFFAVNDYSAVPGFTDLDNPIANARAIASELQENYGFQTEVVENPTLSEITEKLISYEYRFSRSGDFDPEGQLLLFFSGHGKEEYGSGYFLPSDTKPKELYRTTFAYNLWRNRIDAFACQHILVVIDACYSAFFDPGFDNKGDHRFGRKNQYTDTESLLAAHQEYKTRFFFTSDGRGDETPDKSNFAKRLLEGLRSNTGRDGIFTSSALYANYLEFARPHPGGGDFGSDEAGSSFLFFRKEKQLIDEEAVANREKDLLAWQKAESEQIIAGYRIYLEEFPEGAFRFQANQKIEQIADKNDWNIARAKNTADAYREYLSRHPRGEFMDSARATIQGLSNELPAMVYVSGGSLEMGDQFRSGSRDERPVHTVSVSDFYIGRYEVTVEEFSLFVAATNHRTDAEMKGFSLIWNGDEWVRRDSVYWQMDYQGVPRSSSGYDYPVLHVSWRDATAYCNWRSEQDGFIPVYRMFKQNIVADWQADGYRLPTEAEWEYAARSKGEKVKYAVSGDQAILEEYVNFCDNNCQQSWKSENQNDGFSFTAPVGSLRPNGLGVYDMSGNVWEWCWDIYGKKYYRSSLNLVNPQGPLLGTDRVVRGGSWLSAGTDCRTSTRAYSEPDYTGADIGFRLVRSAR